MPRYYDDDDRGDFGAYRDIRRPEHDYSPEHGEMPQSGMGISSLIISLIVGIGLFALIAGATMMTINQVNPPRNDDPTMVMLGLGIMAGLGLALVGLVLGIIGSLQPNRRSLCAVLGSVFNGLILLGVGALICLGLAAGG